MYFWSFLLWLLFLFLEKQRTWGQPNGEGTSVPVSEEELDRLDKERTRNVVRLAATDQLNSEIITNRTRAYLNCESGEMIVKINFSLPFRGVAYSDYDRSSPCKFYGDGGRYYEMRLPLKGCGTKQEAPRLFINNIIVRFHRSLELEEDEIKTIICRYPPPLAPPPPSVVAPILEPLAPVPVIIPAKLSEIELLLIICALLFLTLLLLGIGIAYYCLKRRNIKIIRKKKVVSAPPSVITKLSHSTLFDPIRIPRATAHSTESSETIPSDYPSESLSEDERRTIISETSTIRNDHFRFENSAFIPEPYPPDIEREDSVSNVPVPVAYKPIITKQDYMTTIVETENTTDVDVFNTTHRRTTANLYKKMPFTPKPASIPDNDNRSGMEVIEDVPMREHSIPSIAPSLRGSIPDNDDWSHSEMEDRAPLRPYVKPPKIEMATLDQTFIDNQDTRDIDERITSNRLTTYPPPKITLHKTDDLYVTNISEIETTEHITAQTKGDLTTIEAGPGPRPAPERKPQSWDISIRHHPVEPTREITESYTQQVDENNISSSHMRSTTGVGQPPDLTSPRLVQKPTKFEVIIRILDNPPPDIEGVEQLTPIDKRKFRTIITTDEVFRSLIVESTTIEEYIRISRDIRYEKLFEPRTWEVIIRILTHSEVTDVSHETRTFRYRKKTGPSLPDGEASARGSHPQPGSMISRRTSRSGSVLDYDLRSLTEEDVDFARPDNLWSFEAGHPLRTGRSVAEHSTSEYFEDVPIEGSSARRHQFVERSSNLSEFIVPSSRRYYQPPPPPPPPPPHEHGSHLALSGQTMPETQESYYEQRLPGGGFIRGRAFYERAATQAFVTPHSQSQSRYDRGSSVGEREESKSVTETDIYDQWFRH